MSLGVIGALSVDGMRCNRDGGGYYRDWQERPLSPESVAVDEVVSRRALQLPDGCRATARRPEADRRLDDRSPLPWSMVVPKGEGVRYRMRFTHA